MKAFFGELCKLLSKQTLCFVISFFLLQAALTFFFLNGYLPLDALPGEAPYIEYHKVLEGALTREKEAYVIAEYFEVTTVIAERDDIVSAYGQGLIEADVMYAHTDRYLAAMAKQAAILRIYEQYEYLKREGTSFVYDTGWLFLLRDGEFNWIIPAALGILLIPFYAMEWSGNMIIPLKASRFGIRGIIFRKVVAGAIFAVVFTSCMLLIDCLILKANLPLPSEAESIRCLSAFAEAPAAWSLWQYALAQYAGVLIGSVTFAVLLGCLSLFVPQALPQAAIYGGSLLLPLIILYRFDLRICLHLPSSFFVYGALWNEKGLLGDIHAFALTVPIAVFMMCVSIALLRWLPRYRYNCDPAMTDAKPDVKIGKNA
ncbi:MAG: hypothetical protein FWH17_09370 [Oscillospiraceae bacterium]|nr:hypothetical protein [Oscillospiraceae bacterium]